MKKKPQDLTLRNLHSLHKRLLPLEKLIKALRKALKK